MPGRPRRIASRSIGRTPTRAICRCELEAAKLAALCRQIERSLGIRPRVYRAGRYGKGPNTEAILEEQGFEIDLSPAPAMDFAADGGPDYTRHSTCPFLFGRERRLLCLPTTGAFVGRLHRFGPLLHPLMEQGTHRAAASVRDRVAPAPAGAHSPDA